MPEGGTLLAEARGTTISVSDTGPGLPDDPNSVFDRFVKAADSKGSGLGLSIARDLVEAHGGTIRASNRPEGGATFEVSLPADGSSTDEEASGSLQ